MRILFVFTYAYIHWGLDVNPIGEIKDTRTNRRSRKPVGENTASCLLHQALQRAVFYGWDFTQQEIPVISLYLGAGLAASLSINYPGLSPLQPCNIMESDNRTCAVPFHT